MFPAADAQRREREAQTAPAPSAPSTAPQAAAPTAVAPAAASAPAPATPPPPSSGTPEAIAQDSGAVHEQSHLRSWEQAPIEVTATRLPREEERIGDYGQPRWTVPRRFPMSRIYVIPAGTLQLEWTLDAHIQLEKADERRYRSKYEIEFGLGHRMQVDFFLQTQQTGSGPGSPIAIRRENIEFRYGLADWGVIWGNPALYASWGRRHEQPDVVELKLLLGDALAPRWHWGLNFVWERELGGERSNGYLVIGGLSYTLVDEQLSLGAELRGEIEDVENARFEVVEAEAVIGPSMQWRPQPALHIDIALLVGLEKEPGEAEALFWPWLAIGWEF